MTWSEFNNQVIRMGLYRDPEVQYLIEERLGIMREDNHVNSDDLETTLEQLKKYKDASDSKIQSAG